jgi:hypothetical protein
MLMPILSLLGCLIPDTIELEESIMDFEEPRPSETTSRYLEPQFVGFEFVGGWNEHNDALEPWSYSGLEYEPYIRIILAQEDYFTTSTDDLNRYRYFCEVLANLEGEAAPMDARSHEDDSTAELRGSFVGTLSVFGYGDGECENMNPDRWPGGEARWAVDGIPFGFGVGPHTDFLAAAWDPGVIDVYGDYMLAGWFAYERPDSDGGTEFVAHDWTTALLWKWDAQTGELLVDQDARPIGQTTSDPILSGWLSSYAYFFDNINNFVDLQLNE